MVMPDAHPDAHLPPNRSRSSEGATKTITQHQDCLILQLTRGMLSLVKFSTHDCSGCQAMAEYDAKTAQSLGLSFLNVNMKNPESYQRYRRILLHQHPLRKNLELPTYILVEDPDSHFRIKGEITGVLPEADFQQRIQALLDSATVVSAPATSQGGEP